MAIKDKSWGKYFANISSSTAFTGFMAMFWSTTSAFAAPYEALILYNILITDWYRTSQDAREAWAEKHHLSKRTKAMVEGLILMGVSGALIGGNFLGIAGIIVASPFVFLGIMGYRTFDSSRKARKASTKAALGKELEKKFKQENETPEGLTITTQSAIENYLNLGLKVVLLAKEPEYTEALDKESVYVYLNTEGKLTYLSWDKETNLYSIQANSSQSNINDINEERIKRKITSLAQPSLWKKFKSLFSATEDNSISSLNLDKNNSKDIKMIDNILKISDLQNKNKILVEHDISNRVIHDTDSTEGLGWQSFKDDHVNIQERLTRKSAAYKSEVTTHLLNAAVFATLTVSIAVLFKVVAIGVSATSIVAGVATGVLGANTLRTAYNGPQKATKATKLEQTPPSDSSSSTHSHSSINDALNNSNITFSDNPEQVNNSNSSFIGDSFKLTTSTPAKKSNWISSKFSSTFFASSGKKPAVTPQAAITPEQQALLHANNSRSHSNSF